MEINQASGEQSLRGATHYDITMGNDVASDAYCDITMGNDFTRDIHYVLHTSIIAVLSININNQTKTGHLLFVKVPFCLFLMVVHCFQL